MTLVARGFAALVGVIAIADADSVGSAVGVGAGAAVTVFTAGGTIACAIAFVWTILALLMLGLALAVHPREQLTGALYLGAMVAALFPGLISTWLLASTGGEVTSLSPIGFSSIAHESLLRPLAVALVLLSTLWFGALAASRLERT